MEIGLDSFALHPLKLDPHGELEWTRAHGFAGIQFGDIAGLAEGGDESRIRDLRAQADEWGLYTHVSVGGCSPFCTGLSEAEVVDAAARRVRLADQFGWHELHGFLGGPRERYDLSTPWTEQLEASARVLVALKPLLRDYGSRINLETHGDASTFELVRLAETVGPDVLGICLDTANVILQGEDPVLAARRAAPYTNLTHCKDAIVYFVDRGLRRQTLPPGSGVIKWDAMVTELAANQPDLKLSIEDHKWLFDLEIFEPGWQTTNPEARRDELLELVRLALECSRRMLSGELPDPDQYEEIPYGEELEQRLASGREHLQSILNTRIAP